MIRSQWKYEGWRPHTLYNLIIKIANDPSSRINRSLFLSLILFSIHTTMTIELNTLSYLLLTTIFSAASFIAIQNGKHPDVHPSVLNKQSECATLRYPGESAIVKSNDFPNGAPPLTTRDRTIKTLSELYQAALNKHKDKRFVGARYSTKKSANWVISSNSMTRVHKLT